MEWRTTNVHAPLVLAMLLTAPACSLIDAASGNGGGNGDSGTVESVGPGMCDPRQSGCTRDDCARPESLGEAPFDITVGTCDFDSDRDFAPGDICGPSTNPGFDQVWSFRAPSGGNEMVELCISTPLPGSLTFSTNCDLAQGGDVCLPRDGNCVRVTTASLDSNFIVYRFDPSNDTDDPEPGCNDIRIQINQLPPS
jgi:hypothetical protein